MYLFSKWPGGCFCFTSVPYLVPPQLFQNGACLYHFPIRGQRVGGG